jgi:exosortase family protein XrtF
LVYAVLSLGYKFYLDFSTGEKFYPDYFTNLTARQSAVLISNLGYDVQMIPHPNEPSLKTVINGKYVARAIEGCNSLSVIILFVSFMVAFAGRLKPTLIYILSGAVLIYSTNLIRIALLSIALYHYPWRQGILHEVIFPLIIYGMVFLLWMFWVNRFSIINGKNA